MTMACMFQDTILGMPDDDFRVEYMTGKQGRNNPNKEVYELLTVQKTSVPGDGDMETAQSIAIASKALRLAGELHHFQGGHVFNDDGNYSLATITLSTELDVDMHWTPLFRPTSHGGHVMFRTSEDVAAVVSKLYPKITHQQAADQELGLCMAKFETMNVILLFPPSIDDATLFYKLGLERKGDGTDTVVILNSRLCDGNGLGRSPPHLSVGKFKFLFPGEELDYSHVKARGRGVKRTVDGATKASSDLHIPDICGDLKRYMQDASSGDDTISRGTLAVAFEFLSIFKNAFTDEIFQTTFDHYMKMPAKVVVSILGDMQNIEEITKKAAGDDTEKAEDIMKHCDTVHGLHTLWTS